MSGLEALSMVCSIMQVISFTKEVLTLCKDVYEGRPTTDSHMEENAASIKALLDEMNRSAGSVQKRTTEEKELYAIAQKCSKAAEELQKEVRQVTKHQRPGDYKGAFIAGYKSILGKRKIMGLYDQFCKHQKTLETHILVRLRTRTDAIELQQRENFTQLSDTLKHFVSQFAAGHTDMASLITRDGTRTRQQIQQSEARVKHEINHAQTEAVNEAKKNRLLCSLKYDAMNSRRTGLNPAHEATYVSIFNSLEAETPVADAPKDEVTTAWKNFITWLQSEKPVFWIQGKPGSGKSTLLKYLLQHEKTQAALDKWRPNTLIVSHFFWKPGDILQKNFRGLLCSLNHQMLSSDPTFVGHLLSEHTFTREKDTIGDWELTQLELVFHSMRKQSKRSIFFLIDGLDEATETAKVLQFLNSLISLNNVKLCTSSRGEDVFRQMFSKYDGFKLEHLTRGDMLQFAQAGIPDSYGRYPLEFLEDLRKLLVGKAEGVFLWLVLALQSVKRGLQGNDSQEVIYSRLEQLPSKLEELYADMWDRLGDDKAIYQQEAARYFSLLIANNTLLEEYPRLTDIASHFGNLSSFQLMIATNDKSKRDILDESHLLSYSDIKQRCKDVAAGISTKTAGLLVTHGPDDVALEISQFSMYVYDRVEFLHKTLLEFFQQSEAGKSILAQSQTGCIYTELAASLLCRIRAIHQFGATPEGQRFEADILVPLDYCVWLLGQALVQDSGSNSIAVFNLLDDMESLFEARLIPWDQRPDWYPLPCFDVLLIREPVFEEFLQTRIKSKGTSHATRLLRESIEAYMTVNEEGLRPFWMDLKLMKLLETLGGDVNSADICLFVAPDAYHVWSTFLYLDPRSPIFAPYESMLSMTVKRCFEYALKVLDAPGELIADLVTVLERAPNLDYLTSFTFRAISPDTERAPTKGLYLCALDITARTSVEDPKVDEESKGDTEVGVATIIIEANLRYLVEFFLNSVPSGLRDTKFSINRIRDLLDAESSRPVIRPRFLTETYFSFEPEKRDRGRRYYRFSDEDLDILADNIVAEATFDKVAEYGITFEKLQDYRNRCERVDVSALSVLADEKLGVCRLADMGIKPPDIQDVT